MPQYSSGRESYFLCDRCGLPWDYLEAKTEIENGKPKHNKVCSDCWDADHPQYFVNRIKPVDAMALKDPRPDRSDFTSMFAWNPVAQFEVSVKLGRVRVSTS